MTEKRHTSEINTQIAALESVCEQILAAVDIHQKLQIVRSVPAVKLFLQNSPKLHHTLRQLDLNGEFLINAVLAIGQGPVIFGVRDHEHNFSESLPTLIQTLQEIETFYDTIGGIIGYHLTVLKLIDSTSSPQSEQASANVVYDEPEGLDISQDSPEIFQAVRWGIEHMSELAEIYPVGGAGDRLHLQDEATGQLLPAAQLLFCGRSLLEGMIRDLQGREFLHYKLFGKQIRTPLAIMTSHEKNNHERIQNICEDRQWFGRPKENYFFFIQSLVPMVAEDGFWAMQEYMKPILKPGGHGVIWKMALDQGVFKWLENLHCRKALVRQINNPAAGVDKGLLALGGIGCHQNKDFGFASCFRLLNMPEGMDVLCERRSDGEFEYCITNVEYTDFEKRGIKDVPGGPNSPYSRFPANTNILFIDISCVQRVIAHYPLPGVLINMKSAVTCLEPDGTTQKKHAARLETTMQNIADYIVDRFPKRLKKGERDDLRTFITYNERRKTISVTKQAYRPGKSIIGTPEGCYFELMQNYHDLLSNYCHFQLPKPRDEKTFLSDGPALIVDFHPALGQLYHIIGQKIQRGCIAEGSEWIMEIAEADVTNLDLDGSLLIESAEIMGKKDAKGVLIYDSGNSSKCTLKDVTVRNKGIDRSANNIFWKHEVSRLESLRITLHGNAEFFAENVTFTGNQNFDVPDGHRLVVKQKGNKLISQSEKITRPTWQWKYTFNQNNMVSLQRQT